MSQWPTGKYSPHPTAAPSKGKPQPVWLLLEWREGIPTHCATDRVKARRCIAVSPNRRAAQRSAPSKPMSRPVIHHLLARHQAWGLHHPIHAAAALLGEDNLPSSVYQAFHPYHTTSEPNYQPPHRPFREEEGGYQNAVNAGVARDSSFTQKCGDRVTALRSEEEVVNSGFRGLPGSRSGSEERLPSLGLCVCGGGCG
jgi:hypothetical protein